jgi:hypothetical protein
MPLTAETPFRRSQRHHSKTQGLPNAIELTALPTPRRVEFTPASHPAEHDQQRDNDDQQNHDD